MAQQRLLYATPTGQHPKVGFVASLRALELTCKSFPRELADFQFTTGPVQRARSAICDRAMNSGYDYLVMHDDDLVLAPTLQDGNPIDAWHAILEEHPDVGMVGAVYLRETPKMPCVVMQHPKYAEELPHLLAGYPDQPFEVAGVGTGFVMIRVAALHKMSLDEDDLGRPPLFRFDVQRSRWGMSSEIGEDYGFCTRLRGSGYRVLADPRFPTTHIKNSGNIHFDHTDWERQWAADNLAETPICKQVAEHCPPTFQLIQHNGMLLLDHTGERIRLGEEWARDRAKTKAA